MNDLPVWVLTGGTPIDSSQSIIDNEGFSANPVEAPGDFTNRLISESSPYLLQHAHNPVDWYPWGEEAFRKAKEEDKPIFLSIGYSTCHWCHVMERESFENDRIASLLNGDFISIKVDREERPEIDDLYMKAVQMMTGQGGWPMSVFITPGGLPFFGGTYFPPEEKYGRPGFTDILTSISKIWNNDRKKIEDYSGKMRDGLISINDSEKKTVISGSLLADFLSNMKDSFDPESGGFRGAPKFPQPAHISLLLKIWKRDDDPDALRMAESTLKAIMRGGIYDHIGGGFHRYSTDSKWLIPHFEKMLYDQALMAKVYIEAFQVTKNKEFARVARETLDYILRDMTDINGGFFSAEDADTKGAEGTFYAWSPIEIIDALGAEDAAVFNNYYNVTREGNFEDGLTILNITGSTDALAEQTGNDPSRVQSILAAGRSTLLERRSLRERPMVDDKIITAWNGLMISAMAFTGGALGEKRYTEAAGRAARFLLDHSFEDGRLMRYYRDGKTRGLGVLDDYAFLLLGLIDLYQATLDSSWLKEASILAGKMTALFYDDKNGGFFLTGSDTDVILVRDKPAYDGAIPCGNSVAALDLLRLGRLLFDEHLSEEGEKTLEAFSWRAERSPASLPVMLGAVDYYLGPPGKSL
ncbi:MAG: thioredoxin domain-containing protein [Candidatus Krumholzibacteriota bacterium]|nr:thioredoxin domain-containing protein [Candidatus Krumholzibacteriota bacterium]